MTFRRTRCDHCKRKLDPERRGQIVHVECVEAWQAEQKAKEQRTAEKQARMQAKVERAKDRQAREAMKKLATLIAEAQTQFNAFIRARDRDATCFVCHRPFIAGVPGRNMHAGHVRSRGAAGHLRFNEDNCHGECEGCNGPNGAKPHQIKAGAIERIGLERYEALENNNEPHKWSKDEVRAIRDTYRAKTRALKKEREE